MKKFVLFLLAGCFMWSAWADTPITHQQVYKIALAYAETHATSLPGKIDIQISQLDPRVRLKACSNSLEGFSPAGAAPIGRTTIGVRCTGAEPWTVFLQASITVTTAILVSSRPLSQNTLLSEEDFALTEGVLTHPNILSDPAQAIGKTLKFGVRAGQTLRTDMLRLPYLVTQGQNVDLQVQGNGYTLRSTGVAMGNGTEGQTIQIRVASGKIIQAKVNADGSMEVRR